MNNTETMTSRPGTHRKNDKKNHDETIMILKTDAVIVFDLLLFFQ